jgi:hypothetical protein
MDGRERERGGKEGTGAEWNGWKGKVKGAEGVVMHVHSRA